MYNFVNICQNGILEIEALIGNDIFELFVDYMLTNTLRLLFCGRRLGGAR